MINKGNIMPYTRESLLPLVRGKSKEDILGEGGILKTLVKDLVEAAMDAEMENHLGYSKHATKASKSLRNSRNGYSSKKIIGDFGKAEIEVPRDRNSEFEPRIIEKHQTRFEGFDDKIIAMYARGMSTRDIQAHLKEIYGVDVSPNLISDGTAAVLEKAKVWQNRVLDNLYPIVFFDAIVVKVQENRRVINKAVHLALGVNTDGHKELLGLWITQNEGSKFWLQVLTELKNRGLNDIFIACMDGLTGFPDAVNAVYPKTQIQLCIVHMIRNSLRYVPWKDKKEVVADLKKIYRGATEESAHLALLEFAEKWDKKYPTISKSWESHWHNLSTYFQYPEEIRKPIYTTNAIESVNMSLRKVIKNKRVFPNDDAVLKQFYLALQNISKKWTMPIQNWAMVMSRFSIEHAERLGQ